MAIKITPETRDLNEICRAAYVATIKANRELKRLGYNYRLVSRLRPYAWSKKRRAAP